jgi:hypothetical protein
MALLMYRLAHVVCISHFAVGQPDFFTVWSVQETVP